MSQVWYYCLELLEKKFFEAGLPWLLLCTWTKISYSVAKMSFQRQSPSEFLKQIIGKPVVVKLNSGVDYRGLAMAGLLVRFNKNYHL